MTLAPQGKARAVWTWTCGLSDHGDGGHQRCHGLCSESVGEHWRASELFVMGGLTAQTTEEENRSYAGNRACAMVYIDNVTLGSLCF